MLTGKVTSLTVPPSGVHSARILATRKEVDRAIYRYTLSHLQVMARLNSRPYIGEPRRFEPLVGTIHGWPTTGGPASRFRSATRRVPINGPFLAFFPFLDCLEGVSAQARGICNVPR